MQQECWELEEALDIAKRELDEHYGPVGPHGDPSTPGVLRDHAWADRTAELTKAVDAASTALLDCYKQRLHS